MTPLTPPDRTLRHALSEYFAENGLPADGGYAEEWVRIRIGPIPFRYRNTPSRQRLAPAHDLHHALTGYSTTLFGEGEIGCFEIGSGLRDRTGLWLSLRVIGFVVLLAPIRLFRAFVRGQRSKNLLGATLDDALLDRSLEEVRGELAIRAPAGPASARDLASFLVVALAGVGIVWGPLIVAVAVLSILF